MAEPALEEAGARIETLLGQLGGLPDRRAREWAEDLVRVVTDLYGTALARLLEAAGPAMVELLAADELVGGLLLVHGLHPESLGQRAQGALADLPALMGIEDAKVIDCDEATGAVKVRLILAPGRDKHRETLIQVVRDTVERAAPDVTSVVVDCPDSGAPVRFLAKSAAAASNR